MSEEEFEVAVNVLHRNENGEFVQSIDLPLWTVNRHELPHTLMRLGIGMGGVKKVIEKVDDNSN